MHSAHCYRKLFVVFFILQWINAPSFIFSQTRQANGYKKVAVAYRTSHEKIRIDGRLTEKVWQTLPGITNFIQYEPHEGQPATQKTYVQVAYDDEALYVAFRAYDSAPESIRSYLTRRDKDSPSDWLGFAIDSYFDRRTAFTFLVNPANVKIDLRLSDNFYQDLNWDAVWDVATSIYSNGWVAEFRVPYNQLRFPKQDTLSWGFQAMRVVSRIKETSYWSYQPRDAAGFVSLFGTLKGLRNLPGSTEIQILPYAMGTSQFKPSSDRHPQIPHPLNNYELGCDVKIPFANNLTLDLTVNPDFGQVESDPSEFNLTAYETYFDEKRPFFLEGSHLFKFRAGIGQGRMGDGYLFYSRRIGRIPHGHKSSSPTLGVEQSPATSILGAAKISGRTIGGWSFGILNAVTREETATLYQGTNRTREIIEPLTNYFVSRLQRDFNNGRTVIGGIMTNVLREQGSPIAQVLPAVASSGGLDFTHRWDDDTYELSVAVSGSNIAGDTLAIQKVQLSSARYFQRIDAPHLSYDPKRTSLSGFAGRFRFSKIGTGHWRWSLGGVTRSPGYEINDIGFLNTTDFNAFFFQLGYHQYIPGTFFRWYQIYSRVWRYFDYAALPIGSGLQVGLTSQLLNYWSFYFFITRKQPNPDPHLLRGGPAFIKPGSTQLYLHLTTDEREALSLSLDSFFERNDVGFNRWSLSPTFIIRPAGRLDFSLSLNYTHEHDDLQYLYPLTIDGEPNQILGRLERHTFFITLRGNLAITPNLTLQYYGMPYLSVGHYSKFHSVLDPKADRYADRLQDFASTYNPDFNYREYRSNLVLRWEYRPGSTFYFVWSQGIHNFENIGQYDLLKDGRKLFDSESENVFLIKISRWLTL